MKKSATFSVEKDILMYLPSPSSRAFCGTAFLFYFYILYLFILYWIYKVRDKNERWIRCTMEKGDFLILPAGIYHRFTPAESNFAHAMRLFKDVPKWTAYPRKDGCDFSERVEYLQQIGLAQ